MASILEDIKRGNNNPSEGFVIFDSSDHIRFENNKPVTGHNYNCHRRLVIEKNISGEEGYTVTLYNLDGPHPIWNDNIQMAPKRMRIINISDDVIELRGFGEDQLGCSFADYGLSLRIVNDEITIAQLNMFDRYTCIVYLQ